jgi:hypothetical protein
MSTFRRPPLLAVCASARAKNEGDCVAAPKLASAMPLLLMKNLLVIAIALSSENQPSVISDQLSAKRGWLIADH